MYRVEIISNQSVQDDILDELEINVPNILYTVIPLAYGRGKESRKLGTTTWPETNFVMISYVQDSEIALVKAVIKAVKKKFPREGIKLFIVKAE